MKRKSLIFLLTITSAVSCAVGLSACFSGGGGGGSSYISDGTFEYHIENDGTLTVTDCYGKEGDIVAIPSVYNEMPVTAIGNQAFKQKDIKGVSIPDSVTTIDETAFCYCKNLESLIVSDDNPVYYSDGNCIIERGDNRLAVGCNSSVIPADGSVTAIGANAFFGSGIKDITIPVEVTLIDSAFYDCTEIESVNYTGDIKSWCVISFENEYSNPLFYADKFYTDGGGISNPLFPEEVTEISRYAFAGYSAITNLTITEGIKKIGENAFYSCNNLEEVHWNAVSCEEAGSQTNSVFNGCEKLNRIIIEATAREIPACAFSSCTGVEEITIPENITAIGGKAFYGCNNLRTVNWNATECAGIGSASENAGRLVNPVFDKSKLVEFVNIGEGVRVIPDFVFGYFANLKEVTIPDSVEVIGECAFYECHGIEEIIIPDGVTEMGIQAFYGCNNLKTAVIGLGLTEIAEKAFGFCDGLKNLTIGENVTEIGKEAFGHCHGLCELIIPDGVQTIGAKAFTDCESIRNLVIPDSVVTVRSEAFSFCEGLVSATLGRGLKNILWGAFNGCKYLLEINNLSSLNIEAGSSSNGMAGQYALNIYTAESGQSKITTRNGFRFFADGEEVYLLGYCGSEKQIILPAELDGKSYKIIGYAFIKDANITRAEIPRGVTEIGQSAFSGCAMLESVTISDSVTSIGGTAFSDCTSLKNIIIPDSVSEMGWCTFEDCISLESAVIGSGITQIPSMAFSGCKSLKSLTLGNNVEEIGYHSFEKCESLTEAVIPDSVKVISEYAFYDCNSLERITVGSGVSVIEQYAFYGCKNIKSVSYTGDIESWQKIQFENDYSNPLRYSQSFYINGKPVTEMP